MKAYKLAWPERQYLRVHTKPEIFLPRVYCDECWRTWGFGNYMYPNLDFSFFDEPVFKYENFVDMATFKDLCRRIHTAYGREILLIPGCQMGPFVGKGVTAKLRDFEWGTPCCPLVSKRAAAMLRKHGFNLTTDKCKVTLGKGSLSSYFVIQPEPALLVPDENLEKNKVYFCRACNHYSPDLVVNKPRYYQFIRSKWPKGYPLVMSIEAKTVLASPEFVEAVTDLKLTGLEFVECGEFI